jgi:Domain of unknown function (DUF4410)
MTRKLLLLAIAGSLILTACGTTTSLQDTHGAAITTLSRKFSKVMVQDFKTAVRDKEGKAGAAEISFADRIATEIKKSGKFSNVGRNGKPDANTLVIDGTITKYEEGNPSLRFWIGMGAGSSFFEADVEFHDGKRTSIGKIKVDKNSWALGGGLAAGQTPQTCMDGATEKVAAEAAKLAK